MYLKELKDLTDYILHNNIKNFLHAFNQVNLIGPQFQNQESKGIIEMSVGSCD